MEIIDDDPLFYNETASVGVLAGAATRAGLLALAEYKATKRGSGRGRPHKYGRCDLWISDPESSFSWAFEFKQRFCTANVREQTIASVMKRACRDAGKVHPLEADRCFGALLISARAGETLLTDAAARIESAAKKSTFACRLVGGSESPVYLLLQEVD